MSERDTNTSRERIIEPTQARQAVTGHNVHRVLFVALAAVIVGFIIVYTAFFPR